MIVVVDRHGYKHFLNPMHITSVSMRPDGLYVSICMSDRESEIVVPFEIAEDRDDFLMDACMAVDALVWGADMVLDIEPDEDEDDDDIFGGY